jgi:hypothetical protein
MNVSSSEAGVGLGLGESEAAEEVWGFLLGVHHFDLLSSSMSSQPDLSSSACGRDRGVLSDGGREIIPGACWVIAVLF